MSAYLNHGSTRLKSAETIAIATGVIAPSQQSVILQAESGTTDDLATINITNFDMLSVNSITYRPMLCLIADTGDTITIKHGTGNITLPDDTDVDITDGEFYWLIWNGTAWKGHLIGAGGSPTPITTLHRFEARLSLSSTIPKPTSSITAATTLYLLPYKGNMIDLYDGSADWDEFALGSGGISVAVPASTNTNYDVYVYDSGGLTLEAVAWTNDTTRATALAIQNGVEVKTGATARRYCGTIRTDGVSGQCSLDFGNVTPRMNIWNRYNQAPMSFTVLEATNSWTYATADTWRSANASTANRVTFVTGLNENIIHATVAAYGSSAGSYPATGVALDATNTNNAQIFGSFVDANGQTLWCQYRGYSGIGAHFLQWVEQQSSTATVTWYGDNADTNIQAGLIVDMWG